MKTSLPILAMVFATAATLPAVAQETVRTEPHVGSTLYKASRAQAPADWKFQFDASDIVTATPDGEKKMVSKAGNYYSMSMFGIAEGSSNGMPCTIVEGEDGSYWIYDPFAMLDTKSWLKAQISGDKMTISLPQAIYSDTDDDGTRYVYVAQLCHYELEDAEAQEGLYYAEPGETEIVFNREGESWVMQTREMNDHPMIMGLVAADDGAWCAYSDWNMVFSPFSQTLVTPPSSMQSEVWTLSAKLEDKDYAGAKLVNVGFDNDDVYMSGFSSLFPEAWIKGTLSDGKIIFPSHQYVGADEMANAFGYFYGGVQEEVYLEEWDLTYMQTVLTDNLTFDYDADTGTLESEGTFVVNRGDEDLYVIDIYNAPRMRVQGTVTDFVPQNPIIGFYSEPSEFKGSIYFTFPNINAAGQVLDSDKLYYKVYVDDEPFVFYSDEYVGVEDDTEEIPFLFSNSDTIGYYGTFDVTHFIYFNFTGYESLALQTLYRDGENVYPSELVYVVDKTNVVESMSNSEVTAEEWYDMSGRRIGNPEAGVYVKRILFSDGSVKSIKTIVK